MSSVTAITEASFIFPITPPIGERWVVSMLSVCNKDTVDHTFSLSRGAKFLCCDLSITAKDTIQISGPINLVHGDTLTFTPQAGAESLIDASADGLIYTLG